MMVQNTHMQLKLQKKNNSKIIREWILLILLEEEKPQLLGYI